ncbi:hypothetical protein [Comamonas sp.]|uniref:hypothetical protein n=1 Tax=Comamonas sp. TaxID=34028 RepID=UPI00289B706A|nr:hypothetical protein [Comamonas sp.]
MNEEQEDNKPSDYRWREYLRPWFAVLSLLSLLWVGWILWRAWPQAQAAIHHFDGRWLGLTLAGTTLGGYLMFEVFYMLFRQGVGPLHKKRELAHLFFVGQLMKHLPGRVWGIAYQAAQTTHASLRQWLGLNVAYMLLTMFFSVWVALIIILYFLSKLWFLTAFLGGLALYFALCNIRIFEILRVFLIYSPFANIVQWINSLEVYTCSSLTQKLRIIFLSVASWFCYYLAWGFFGYAWPNLGFSGGLQICAYYTLAWLVGYLAFIFPSGAGIRELVFLYFAKDFPPDALAAMVVFGRLVLMITDILLGTFFIVPKFLNFRKAK